MGAVEEAQGTPSSFWNTSDDKQEEEDREEKREEEEDREEKRYKGEEKLFMIPDLRNLYL